MIGKVVKNPASILMHMLHIYFIEFKLAKHAYVAAVYLA